MEQLILTFSNNKFLSIIIAFFTVALETFFPIIPLLALVIANSIVLGMWQGFIISWISSSIASIILYVIGSKFSKSKYIDNYIKKKNGNILQWIKNKVSIPFLFHMHVHLFQIF